MNRGRNIQKQQIPTVQLCQIFPPPLFHRQERGLVLDRSWLAHDIAEVWTVTWPTLYMIDTCYYEYVTCRQA